VIAGSPQRIVVVGNCQAEVVAKGLSHGALRGRFAATYHFVELEASRHEEGRCALAECDVVLAQDIANFDNYALRLAIPAQRPVVSFPCLRFASLWPFDGRNGPDDKLARQREGETGPFTHFDGLLGRLRSRVPEPEARFAAYRTLAVGGMTNFVRLHEFETRRLATMDRQFGCRIGDFILGNFRAQRLFRATGLPSPGLYRMLMQLILDRLGSATAYPEDPMLGLDDADEVPVHPLVAEALGVTWAGEDASYLFRGKQVRWEDYVRTYIERFG
jgi:hypothetical protein